MIRQIVFAATCAAFAAGCATSSPPAAVATNGSTGKAAYYCWKERLATEGGSLVCNWEASVAEACRSNGTAAVKRSSSAAPQSAGMCNNGQWLVMVPAA
jgi:hypothetical protein